MSNLRSGYDVFVGYSRKDKPFVDRLVADLRDHHIRPFQDTLELQVGDQHRFVIEEVIAKCKYFCFVISPASLRSCYARRIELEAAFSTMIQTKRADFVLPLMLRHPEKRLPPLLAATHYLDFTKSSQYMAQPRQLVRKVRLEEESFTGERLYKNIDTSLRGQMVGVGEPLKQIPRHGTAVRVFYRDGYIRLMETYTDSKPDGTKAVGYDSKMRVREITLFRNNEVIDTWFYTYDRRGRRAYKDVARPGYPPHVRLFYDADGQRIREQPLTTPTEQFDQLPDASGLKLDEVIKPRPPGRRALSP